MWANYFVFLFCFSCIQRGAYPCTVRDEITLKEKSVIQYNLITRADVEIDEGGAGVTLRQNGKECKISFNSSVPDFKITVGDLTPLGGFNNEDEEKFAGGIVKVSFHPDCKEYKKYAEPAKRIRLTFEALCDIILSAKITPLSGDTEYKTQDNTSLDNWEI